MSFWKPLSVHGAGLSAAMGKEGSEPACAAESARVSSAAQVLGTDHEVGAGVPAEGCRNASAC